MSPAGLLLAAVLVPLGPGTTGLLVEDHRAPVVELRIEVPAGTASPWVRRSGAADAWEIQGRDPEGRLEARAAALGARVAWEAGARASVLRAAVLREDLPALLALVRDTLANDRFDLRELRRRRRADRVAWAVAQKDPAWRLRRGIVEALFPPGDLHRLPYERPPRPVTGARRLAEARDRLVRLAGRTVGIAGPVGRAEFESLARDLLPPEAPPPADLAPPVPAPLADPPARSEVVLPRLTQAHLALARSAPGVTDPAYAALLVADHVLGGHFYARLSVALRHERGETYGAGTWAPADPVAAPYALLTFTRSARAGEVQARLRSVLETFHREGITEEERASAAGHLLGRRPLQAQTPGEVLDRALRERRLGLPPGGLDALEDRAATLPLEEVNRFIRAFHDPARFVAVQVRGPHPRR